MQIIKPRAIGLLHKTYHWRRPRCAVAGLLFFRLGEAQPVPLPEFEQWSACLGQLAPGSVLDAGFAKPCGEVLLAAQGHPPRGRLLPPRARVRVGHIDKRVRLPSGAAAPLPELLPLELTDARRQRFHGSYDKRWLETVHPGLPDDTDPRLFQAAPPDQQLARGWFSPGTAYRLTHLHPTQDEIAGCVPALRLRAFVEQLVPGAATPGVHEIPMVLETLWFFPEILLGVALHRGEFSCADSDGVDLKRLLLAQEHAAAAPRPAAHYQEVLALRSDPRTALGQLFNEAPLLPARSAEQEAARAARIEAETQAQQAAVEARRSALRQHWQQQLAARLPAAVPGVAAPGKAQESVQESAQESAPGSAPGSVQESAADAAASAPPEDSLQLPLVPASLLQDWDLDLTPLIEAGTRIEAQLQQELQQRQQALQAQAAQWQQRYGGSGAAPPETDADVEQRCQARVFVVAAGQQDAPPAAPLLQQLAQLPVPELQTLQQAGHMNLAALQEALQLKARAQRQGRQAAPEPMVQVALTPTQKTRVRSLVQEWLATGAGLAGRDLAGADLAGLDFSGCDLRDVMLEQADLRGCRFAGAQLDGAALTGAQLDQADFTGASLLRANLSRTRGSAASFRDSCLDGALLGAAALPEADFSGCRGERVLAEGADFTGACFICAQLAEAMLGTAQLTRTCWDEASLRACILMNAVLTDSRWQRAQLQRCIAVGVAGTGADFSGARLDSVQFSNTGSLAGACFDAAVCRNVGFRGLDLSGLRARGAVFRDCDFCETTLAQAALDRSVFQSCLLMQVAAADSRWEESLFAGSVLRKSDFSRSRLDDTEFSHCTLAQLTLERASTRRQRRHPRPGL